MMAGQTVRTRKCYGCLVAKFNELGAYVRFLLVAIWVYDEPHFTETKQIGIPPVTDEAWGMR